MANSVNREILYIKLFSPILLTSDNIIECSKLKAKLNDNVEVRHIGASSGMHNIHLWLYVNDGVTHGVRNSKEVIELIDNIGRILGCKIASEPLIPNCIYSAVEYD